MVISLNGGAKSHRRIERNLSEGRLFFSLPKTGSAPLPHSIPTRFAKLAPRFRIDEKRPFHFCLD